MNDVLFPLFFPSISSVAKTKLKWTDLLKLVISFDFPQFLISAYDIYHIDNRNEFNNLFQRAIDQSQIIMLDSGIYEKTWKNDPSWTEREFKEILEKYEIHIKFNFDDYIFDAENSYNLIDNIVQHYSNYDDISIIVHSKSPELFVDTCYEIAKELKPDFIAIPERELGFGIYEVAINISKIRMKLKSLEEYQHLHILGTGNPISILIYSLCGADSFDGLDWCQTVVDYNSATLHHWQHLDFFTNQSDYAKDKNLDYFVRLLAHNLSFYKIWMDEIQNKLKENMLGDMIEKYISKDFYLDLEKKIGL